MRSRAKSGGRKGDELGKGPTRWQERTRTKHDTNSDRRRPCVCVCARARVPTDVGRADGRARESDVARLHSRRRRHRRARRALDHRRRLRAWKGKSCFVEFLNFFNTSVRSARGALYQSCTRIYACGGVPASGDDY